MINNMTLENLVTEQASRFLVPEISFEDKRLVLFFCKLGGILASETLLMKASSRFRSDAYCPPAWRLLQ